MNPIRTVAIGAVCAVTSHATAFFFANTSITTGFGPEFGNAAGNGPDPVSSYLDRNFEHNGFEPGTTNVVFIGFTHSEAFATAGRAGLGVRTFALADNRSSATPLTAWTGRPEDPGNGVFFTTPGAQARLSTDDVRINPLPGVLVGPGATVPVSLNLSFDGAFAADRTLAAGAGAGNASMTLSIRIRFGYVDPVTHNQFAAFFGGDITASENAGGVQYGGGSGLLTGFLGGSILLTTPDFTVPVGLPIDAEITLSLIGSATSDGHRLESILANFDHTLAFPSSGNVFNVPAGYTAEAPSLYVLENGFTAVPEPGDFALVAALGCVGWIARRSAVSKQ